MDMPTQFFESLNLCVLTILQTRIVEKFCFRERNNIHVHVSLSDRGVVLTGITDVGMA